MDMNEEELYQVGAITKAHGLRGEVKVYPMTDDPERFQGASLLLKTKEGMREVHVEKSRRQKNLVILKFREYDDINEVEGFRQCGLFVRKKDRVPLEENEYFIADLKGCRVVSDEGEEIGELKDVLTTGANDVYIVGCPGKKNVLIPAISQCILDVDVDGRLIRVHLLEGLI